ncbi:MAG TPA: YraN family protein [Terriglobales bacterium]|jgi:putative endonuclease|nr:YraN family protein [Terriglobales bacterium]
MSGRVTRFALRVLDRLARLLLKPPAIAPHQTVGASGEEDAYFYLRRLGYVMVARNWRSPRRHGEIDLVGWDGNVLCFVEVKSRSTRDVKPAEAAVDAQKQDELGGMAREYLRHVAGSPSWRFDVLSLYYDRPGTSPQITLFKNAFSVS